MTSFQTWTEIFTHLNPNYFIHWARDPQVIPWICQRDPCPVEQTGRRDTCSTRCLEASADTCATFIFPGGNFCDIFLPMGSPLRANINEKTFSSLKTLPAYSYTNQNPHKMPRQRRSAPAPRTQTRSAHTAAAPVAAAPHHPPASVAHPQTTTQQGPGLFGQMASTAAGVAVGSTIGHTLGAGITSMFGGSSSSAPVEQPQQQVAASQQQTSFQEQGRNCDVDARSFTRCLEENSGNMQICDYYLQQLRACQEAARPY